MIIGIDFDNTIVAYDLIFHNECVKRNLIPFDTVAHKDVIKDYLIERGLNEGWLSVQGHVYGEQIKQAKPFAGIIEFFAQCKRAGIKTYIISHKTMFPYSGQRINLHEAAHEWLENNGFYDYAKSGLTKDDIFFAATPKDKHALIEEKKCTIFIDDLISFLSHDRFPRNTRPVLFSPHQIPSRDLKLSYISSWTEALSLLPSNNQL